MPKTFKHGITRKKISGDIERVKYIDDIPGAAIFGGTIDGNVKYVQSSGEGLLSSNVNGDIRFVSARWNGLFNSHVTGNVGGIYAKGNALAYSNIRGFIGWVKSKRVFHKSFFNLIVGNVECQILDDDCHLTNLVISNKLRIKSFNGTANVIIPYEADGFISYKSNFYELMQYAINNPLSLIGLRCVKTDVRTIKNLEELLELEKTLRQELLNINFLKYFYRLCYTDQPSKIDWNSVLFPQIFSQQVFPNNLFTDTSIFTGSRQLLLTYYLKLRNNSLPDDLINREIGRVHTEVKSLEMCLDGTPTFGCEFYLERKAIESLNPNYNFNDKVELTNILLNFAGNKDIRECTYFKYMDTVELRINPSYAPIIISLSKELFGLGILPRDVLIGYSINIVGESVLENGVPLILVNYFTGLTPRVPTSDGEFAFRDVHVYHGATVNPKIGILESGTPQLNIFSGVTAKVESNEQLKPYKEILENDVEERIGMMSLPFLVSPEYMSMWKKAIYEIFGFTRENINMLEKKLKDAENENRVWKTSQDLRVFDSQIIRDKIKELYSRLEDRLLLENPQVYLQISSAKL